MYRAAMGHEDNSDFDARIAQVEAVATAVAKFENPELQIAAFRYLLGKDPTVPEAVVAGHYYETPDVPIEEQAPPAEEVTGGAGNGDTGKRSASKGNASKKQTLTFDKSLNFYSTGGEIGVTLKEFTEVHPSKSAQQRAVVVVYWLTNELGLSPLSVDHVYSAFRTLTWPIPASLLNTLQKAGSANFLDTKKSTDIKMTTHGENLVESKMVPKANA